MQLSLVFVCIAILAHAALALPVIDVRITTNAFGAPLPAVTHFYALTGSSLATIKSTDTIDETLLAVVVDLANDQIVTKAFETAAKLTEVVCEKAGPIACVTTAVIAVIGVFFLAYKTSGKREWEHVFMLDYPPMAGVSTRFRLENEAPEGDWRLIGNATVHGVFHAIHYKRNGTLNGLRSIQFGSVKSASKRAEDNDGGVVVDYNWNSISETAYDSFDSTQTLVDDFSNDIVGDMQAANGIQSCADFEDSDGVLDSGLVSIGWNNVPFQFADGQLEGQLDECAGDD